MADKPGTFEIGLAMAGAISAGAYSAGALDFLFQALEEWEKAKRANPGSVPPHNVCIKVISGASAGSVTGALAAAALGSGLRPVPFDDPPPDTQPYHHVLPALYETWVVRPDMAKPGGGPDLLSTSDLEGDGQVVSLLNADILDSIGEEALHVPAGSGGAPLFGPLAGGEAYPYIAKNLHLYLTVSNLRGVPYRIAFETGGPIRGYGMLSHGDRAHYVLNGLGTAERESAWADRDRGTALNIGTLPAAGAPLPPQWRDYLQAALASAAFPAGLAPRRLARDTGDYAARSWPIPREPDYEFEIEPDWPETWLPPGTSRPYAFINVDGGLINNEPFEYAHFALIESGLKRNPREGEYADRAVLMVDPFPEDPHFETDETKLNRALLAVVKSLIPVLKDQARFKPTEIALALRENVYSRFLLAPRRAKRVNNTDVLMRYAIATGLLSGFGGFLDRTLREHDYQLGRRNCQRFLAKTFALLPGNPLIAGSPAKQIAGWTDSQRKLFRITEDGKVYHPIIPLVGTAAKEVPAPNWQKIKAERLNTIVERIAARADVLVPKVVRPKSNWIMRWVIKLGWKTFGAGVLRDYIFLIIQKDLIKRDQHADWALASDDERDVFAALSDPSFDYRTVPGIALSTGLKESVVLAVLAAYPDRVYVAEGRGPDGGNAYTLESRKPGWFARNLGHFTEPTVG